MVSVIVVSPPEWRAWPHGAKAAAVEAMLQAGRRMWVAAELLAVVDEPDIDHTDVEALRELVAACAPDAPPGPRH